MTSDDGNDAPGRRGDPGLTALGGDELAALVASLDLRVRHGTATLEDFGTLARTRLELARRDESSRAARLRGASDGV